MSELESAVVTAGNNFAALAATIEQLKHQVKSQNAEIDRLHKTTDEDHKHHYEELAQLKNVHTQERASLSKSIETANAQLFEMRFKSDDSSRQLLETQSKLEQSQRQLAEV